MSEATQVSPKTGGGCLIILVHVVQVALGLVALMNFFWRSHYEEISRDMFGEEAPLMNSLWVDILIRPSMAIPFLLAVVAFLFWRRKLDGSWKRLTFDLSFVAVVFGLILIQMIAVSLPILRAEPL